MFWVIHTQYAQLGVAVEVGCPTAEFSGRCAAPRHEHFYWRAVQRPALHFNVGPLSVFLGGLDAGGSTFQVPSYGSALFNDMCGGVSRTLVWGTSSVTVKGAYGNVTEEVFVVTLLRCSAQVSIQQRGGHNG